MDFEIFRETLYSFFHGNSGPGVSFLRSVGDEGSDTAPYVEKWRDVVQDLPVLANTVAALLLEAISQSRDASDSPDSDATMKAALAAIPGCIREDLVLRVNDAHFLFFWQEVRQAKRACDQRISEATRRLLTEYLAPMKKHVAAVESTSQRVDLWCSFLQENPLSRNSFRVLLPKEEDRRGHVLGTALRVCVAMVKEGSDADGVDFILAHGRTFASTILRCLRQDPMWQPETSLSSIRYGFQGKYDGVPVYTRGGDTLSQNHIWVCGNREPSEHTGLTILPVIGGDIPTKCVSERTASYLNGPRP